jgi:hypothetical protein
MKKFSYGKISGYVKKFEKVKTSDFADGWEKIKLPPYPEDGKEGKDEGDEGDADGELEDRWRGDMRDMYNMHRGWLRCQDCGGLPDFDKKCCKECEGDNFRDGILSISIDDTMAFMLPQG